MRLIDADALNKSIEEEFDGVCTYDVSPSTAVSDFERIVDAQPTIEAVEVVHAEIITVFGKAIGHQRCSVCGNELEWKAYPNYCDNCGAKLKGGAE